MSKKITAYISLLRADGSEPEISSGYARSCLGEVDLLEIPVLLRNRQIPFPDVLPPGYGDIVAIAVYDQETEGEALWIWPLPAPMDVHAGVTPVIMDGTLYRGVEVKAQVILRTSDLCGAGGV